MTTLAGAVVAITGAGSGIGRALAGAVAARGASLALSDRDQQGLAETAQLVSVQYPSTRVHTSCVDVADAAAVHGWAEQVAAHYRQVNVVINNAGVAFSGDIVDSTVGDLEWVMSINFWGVVHGTTAFLPHLRAAPPAHIVNISSLFGLIAVPSQSQYVAAKFAVRGWTEALREELLVAGERVQVSCVHPGGIKTAIARRARAAPGYDQAGLARFFDAKLAKMSADRAAHLIVRGVERDRPRIIVGRDAVALDLLQRLVGARYQGLVAAVAGRTRAVSTRGTASM